ncbi:MAG TPA: hypothetical protein VJ021_00040 [Thermoplasmata archaeon]|nr:hypothetical protein [Thermoplasmata archaeon]
MEPSPVRVLIPELTQRPTSVFLHGSNRALLNWVMYALLDRSDPNFRWTDVRLREEPLDPLDPLARHVVPESRLSLVEPDELQRSPDPSASLSTLVRPDEPAESIRRTLAFLRLPTHTQDLISRTSPRDTPAQFGLSNAHRLLAAFPAATVQPTLRAILDSGVTLVMTWADAAPAGSRAYDFVLGLEGGGPADWKDAVLHCVVGNSEGPVRAGRRLKLGQLGPIVDVLGPMGLSRS